MRVTRSLLLVGGAGLALIAAGGCDRMPLANAAAGAPAAAATSSDAGLIARGEYLVRIGQCNDCHTPGYAERQGELPTSQWLTGPAHAFVGPWGTTFPSNLRLRLAQMDEASWMTYSAHLRTRPPMPDYTLRAMSDEDRRAIYRFVRSLGPAGTPAPAYLPPGRKPPPPYMEVVLPPAPAAAEPAG